MFAWLDLITGAHHREVCAQYDSRLAAAADRIREAEAREEAEREERRKLEAELIANIFPKRQAAEHRRPIRTPEERATKSVPVPLDPNDDVAIVKQALRETGSRNARVVLARAQRTKDMLMRGEKVMGTKRIEMPQRDVEAMIQDVLAEGERLGIAAVEAPASQAS